MNDQIKRVMAERFRAIEEDLANIRQWYYLLSTGERQTFKRDIQALVQSAKPFRRSCLNVEVRYETTAHAQDGDTITVKACRSPDEILRAIEDWDLADERDPAII